MGRYAKAVVAFFAAPLTYIAGQLAIDAEINAALTLSYVFTAILVWAVPNRPMKKVLMFVRHPIHGYRYLRLMKRLHRKSIVITPAVKEAAKTP